MEVKKVKLSLVLIAGLVVLSFAFFVSAENKSSTGNNIFLDSDQDGLTDTEEKAYGTNPYDSDTDKDGYSDGAEVKSGYDPRKPAPGDKIVAQSQKSENGQVLGESSGENMTNKLAQKMYEIISQDNPEEKTFSIDEIKNMVGESFSTENQDQLMLPEIDKKSLKIKKQNYSGLSEEKAKEKKKDDFTNYITAIFYILSSNSPKPLTSVSDITSVSAEISQEIMLAIESQDPAKLEDLSQSGEKMLGQMKEVEVPEELLDIHIKALSFAEYARGLKNNLTPNPNDPLKDIANMSKIQGFIESIMAFSEEARNKFSEYGVTYDDNLKNKLKSYGLEFKDTGLLEKLSE